MAETDTAAVSVLHADTMRSADMMNHLKNLVHERCCSFNVVMNTVHPNNHNMDCWYHMEEQMKPLLEESYDQLNVKSLYVISGGDEDE